MLTQELVLKYRHIYNDKQWISVRKVANRGKALLNVLIFCLKKKFNPNKLMETLVQISSDRHCSWCYLLCGRYKKYPRTSSYYMFCSFGIIELMLVCFEYKILLKSAQGAVRDVAVFSIFHKPTQ